MDSDTYSGMSGKEIRSPEVPQGTPTPSRMGTPANRKKLGMYFIESDDRRTALGGGYTGGATPVNIRGKPISDLSKTGGWIAAFFIFGTPVPRPLFELG